MIEKKVLDYVQRHHMLENGDFVVAGVSGGADSVCLLLLLCELRREVPITLHVVHINHGIREDAGADAAYVRELCEKFNIPFSLVECDVESLARQRHVSTEEAGRDVRYEAFYRTLESYKGNRTGKIAIAHNKNDCCETFLFHLFRGSSLKGLCAIPPVRNEIIRPLLCLERREIEEFLDKNGIKYCIDSTNLEDNYTRNKIRRHILGTAQEEINPAAVSHIYRACTEIGEAYSLVEELAETAYSACVSSVKKGNACGLHIEKASFETLHATVQGAVVMKVLEAVAESRKNLERVHLEQVRRLFSGQSGRQIDLPYQLCVERDYTGVFVYRANEKTVSTQVPEYLLSSEEHERLLRGECVRVHLNADEILVFSIKSAHTLALWKNIPQNKYTKWLDYDKIKNSIVIRTRKEGDYLTIDTPEGAVRKKTLKSYLIDNKVPKEQRGALFLVTEQSHVLWIVGGRISSFYKVSDNTERVLELRLIKENKEQKG